MDKLILLIIFTIVLVAFLAHPAPQSIEIEDIVLILLPALLSILCIAKSKTIGKYQLEGDALVAILFYCASLILSVLLGFLNGVPTLSVLRAIGPYINFFPLLAISLLLNRTISPWFIAITLIFVGTIQASYQLFLYLRYTSDATSTLGVLRGRITLIDPRTTIPMIFSICILPFTLFSTRYPKNNMNIIVKGIAISLILLGFFGGIATLTRSIMLSILFGWVILFILQFFFNKTKNNDEQSQTKRKFILYSIVFVVVFCLLSSIPQVYMIEQGLLARFAHSSSSSHVNDYSNGRLYDEWLPAITLWVNSDIFSLFFGIGAGNAFTILTGESRTYIHNLMIYSLVYGGIFGLISLFVLYGTLFKILISRAYKTGQVIYLGFAALLASLFFYGQLFAVHKGLAFNAMLFLIMALALYKPHQNEKVSST